MTTADMSGVRDYLTSWRLPIRRDNGRTIVSAIASGNRDAGRVSIEVEDAEAAAYKVFAVDARGYIVGDAHLSNVSASAVAALVAALVADLQDRV